MTEFIYITLAGLLGAFFGRMDGGGAPKTPEIVDRLCCISFFVIACIPYTGWWSLIALVGMFGLATGHGQYFLNVAMKAIEPERLDFIVKFIWGFTAIFKVEYPKTLSFFAKFGYYLDAINKQGTDFRTDERYKYLRGTLEAEMVIGGTEYFKSEYEANKDKLYYRNLVGMFVTGTLVGLPAGLLLLSFGYVLPAFIISLSGIAKTLAYHVAYKLFKSTEQAEWINGFLRTVLAATVFVMII